MAEFLEPIFGRSGVVAAHFLITLLVILLILAIAVWLVGHLSTLRFTRRFNRGGLRRLTLIDAIQVDSKRRAVLLRRDNVEHLILIGGPTDIVVEHHPRSEGERQRPPEERPAADRRPADKRQAPPLIEPQPQRRPPARDDQRTPPMPDRRPPAAAPRPDRPEPAAARPTADGRPRPRPAPPRPAPEAQRRPPAPPEGDEARQRRDRAAFGGPVPARPPMPESLAEDMTMPRIEREPSEPERIPEMFTRPARVAAELAARAEDMPPPAPLRDTKPEPAPRPPLEPRREIEMDEEEAAAEFVAAASPSPRAEPKPAAQPAPADTAPAAQPEPEASQANPLAVHPPLGEAPARSQPIPPESPRPAAQSREDPFSSPVRPPHEDDNDAASAERVGRLEEEMARLLGEISSRRRAGS